MKTRAHLLAGAAICAVLPAHLSAQDLLLGTIELGESQRSLQTDTAKSTTVIDQDELDARQASSMTELLDSIPNVALVNGGSPQGAAISIRGLGTQSGTYGTDGKIAVVIDGVTSGAEEIYRNGSMFALEPELFRNVAVTRGPAESFRYTSGAIGGTVEAQTKEAADFLEDGDTFALRQKLGYESNGDGYTATTILAFAPDDKFDLLAFAGYRTVGDRKDGDGTVQAATGFDQPSALLKATYRPTEDSTFTFGYAYNKIPEFDVPYNAYLPSWSDALVDRNTEDHTSYLSYRYNPVDNDLINLEARLTYKQEKMFIQQVAGAGTNTIYNADHDTSTIALRIENEALFSTGIVDHTLTAGIEASERTRKSSQLAGPYAGLNDGSAPGGTDRSISVYVADKMEVGDKLTLTPQLRFEHQTLTSQGNDFDYVSFSTLPAVADGTSFSSSAFTGALSARYAVTSDFAVFGTLAYNENLPILDDLRVPTVRETSEKGRTIELGFSYDTLDAFAQGDHLQAKLTGFKTHIWDGTTYSGVSTTDLEGVEIELSYVHPAFYADFNAAMMRGTINGTDDDYKWAPADSVQLTLGKTFWDEQFDLSVEAKHAWAQTRTSDTNAAYYPGTVPSDAYTTLALSAAYKPNSGWAEGVEFRATIENLTDETYRPYLSTRNASGRNLKLSIAKTF
ncbi:TonB-dependent receptor domain-containing protein [Celeribacter sp.]|uniref:TonB-dependent receptor domain-containing protein n=1 Tax=Celeribacter sp. TaxID=1890673 RepID=UPI003A946FF9